MGSDLRWLDNGVGSPVVGHDECTRSHCICAVRCQFRIELSILGRRSSSLCIVAVTWLRRLFVNGG